MLVGRSNQRVEENDDIGMLLVKRIYPGSG